MWMFVFFDLPTDTPADRKRYAKFRKDLLNDGFSMLQYSVYIRHCPSKEAAQVHARRVNAAVPSLGHVSLLQVTDHQFGGMVNIWGKKEKEKPAAPQQLAFL